MEVASANSRVLAVFESVISRVGLTKEMIIKDIIQDSLSLMKIIVGIEAEFDIFLDDIDFIALYNMDIEGFIDYAKIK